MGIRREHTRIVNGKIVPVQQAIIKDKASSDGLQTSKSFMLNNISIGPSEPEILGTVDIGETAYHFVIVPAGAGYDAGAGFRPNNRNDLVAIYDSQFEGEKGFGELGLLMDTIPLNSWNDYRNTGYWVNEWKTIPPEVIVEMGNKIEDAGYPLPNSDKEITLLTEGCAESPYGRPPEPFDGHIFDPSMSPRYRLYYEIVNYDEHMNLGVAVSSTTGGRIAFMVAPSSQRYNVGRDQTEVTIKRFSINTEVRDGAVVASLGDYIDGISKVKVL